MAHHFVPNFTREMSKTKNKNHISQCKTAQNLGLSPSTIHNIVKRFRESREITVHVGQGRKPQLNVLDLWALRWHCIRNRHAAVLNIAAWAQEHFRKPQSAAASRNATWISVTLGESYISILCSDAAGFSGPELISDSQKDNVKMCAVLRWVHISTCLREKWISSFQSQRPKGPSRLSLATEAKANVCHGMGVQQSKQHGWLAYVQRYYWHGGIDWDCTET